MRIGRYESSDSNTGTAIAFLFIGLGVGAALGLLLAPKTGKQLRKDLRRSSRSPVQRMERHYQVLPGRVVARTDSDPLLARQCEKLEIGHGIARSQHSVPHLAAEITDSTPPSPPRNSHGFNDSLFIGR